MTGLRIPRFVYIIFGHVSLVLGVIGIFLPLLPTTPFLLLASYCYSKGSERFNIWLLNHPRFGPGIRDWRARGVINPRAKGMAVLLILTSGAVTLSLPQVPMVGKVGAALILGCITLFILSRPSR